MRRYSRWSFTYTKGRITITYMLGIGEDPDGFKGDHIIPLGFENMSLEMIVQLQMIDDDI
jgi:hypothetical protein